MQQAAYRTTFDVDENDFKIGYQEKTLLVGSCFTKHIGQRLIDYKFQALRNPFGVIFNPISLANNLKTLINEKLYKEEQLTSFENNYFNFDFHGSFRNKDKNKCLEKINQQVSDGHAYLSDCNFLFISFGTAWVYKYNETNTIVANCHKLPQNLFSKSLLEIDDIVTKYNELLKEIKKKNPEMHVCFTLSPVKHWKDGAINNQLSKATLLVAIHQIVKENDNCSYFPAYELIIDDLRDYRFYTEDMLHPNKQAISYIWEFFKQSYIDRDAYALMKTIANVRKASEHIPLHTSSDAFKRFVKEQLSIIQGIEVHHKHINMTVEKIHFKSLLKAI